MDIGVCNSYLLVDLSKLKNNVSKIREHIGKECSLMPVLKGNAYGHGIVEVAKYLEEECRIKIIANAQVFESIKLRENGVNCELFVMGGVPENNIEAAIKNDIQLPVFNIETAKLINNEAKKQTKIANVHIKIETGLNRIGIKAGGKLDELLDFIKTLEYVNIKGSYTHYAESDAINKSFAYEQYKIFRKALEQFDKKGIKLDYIHACNSAATVWFKDSHFNLIRAAGIVFGYDPNLNSKDELKLERAATWKAFITNIKELEKNEPVGYNRVYICKDKTKVATLSFGYGDGYVRTLALKGGELLVKGKRAPIIGICMDQTFIDVSHIKNLKIGDEVIILGTDGDDEIHTLEFQELLGEPYVYPLCAIGQRVKRIYTK